MHPVARQGFHGPLGFVFLSIILLPAGRVEADVTLSVTSATVSQPGEMTRICVMLDSGGQLVAGTQNELVWDGTCATIEDPRYACQASPGHGKQLSSAFPPGRDFTLRAFLLSLSDVSPISQRELYCCSVRSELTEPGSSCPINITNVGSSNPDGVALRTQSGGPGAIRYAGSAREPEPIVRAPAGSVRPPSAVGGNLDAGQPAGQPAPAPAPGGAAASAGAGGGAPVVLPGGGERAPAAAPPAVEEAATSPGAAGQAIAPAESTPGAAAPPPAAPVAAAPARPAEAAAPAAPAPGAVSPPADGQPKPVVAAEPEAAEGPAVQVEEPDATPPATAPPSLTPTGAPTQSLPPAAEPRPDAGSRGSPPWATIALILAAAVAGVLVWLQRARKANQRRS